MRRGHTVSRLDSFIRRVSAQRDCLNHAFRLIGNLTGPILELGLGNGRTYYHLRENCPEREIFVFECEVRPHPDCMPDPDYIFEGDIFETLPRAAHRIDLPAVMAHIDMVSGDDEIDRRIAAFLSRQVPPMMAEQSVILCDQELQPPNWESRPLPDGIPEQRYFYYAYGF